MLIYDAITRSKLLYGLETVQLTEATAKKLDVFQLKGLRQILRLQTTFVNRANSNKFVFEMASKTAYPDPQDKRVIPRFSEFHRERNATLLGHILRASDDDPLREVTFQPSSAYRVEYGQKRVGKPKQNWIHQTKKYIRVEKQHLFTYDETEAQHDEILKWAQERKF